MLSSVKLFTTECLQDCLLSAEKGGGGKPTDDAIATSFQNSYFLYCKQRTNSRYNELTS